MSLEFADRSMSDALLRIWLNAFPEDDKEDVGRFFSEFLEPDKCAVWTEDGIPVSMTFMLPAELVINGQASLKLIYIYAAATLTGYRGRGIFGALLTEVHGHLRENGIDACFLHPAESSLYGYYERLGYKTYFRVCTETIDIGRLQAKPAANISRNAGRYNAKTRDMLLGQCPVWVKWPNELVLLALDNAERFGGAVVEIDGGWAICEPFDGGLFIREWLCMPESEELLLQSVISRFADKKIIRRRPVFPNGRNKGDEFGMICPLSLKAEEVIDNTAKYAPYMGLAFD